MLQITDEIQLDKKEIQFRFIRSPGPGGQHVNKASTAVQLRFDLVHSQSLPEMVRRQLVKLAGTRVNAKGVLIITANRFRSQDQNRKDALDRLKDLIEKATFVRKSRRRTQPSKASIKKRIDAKKRRGKLKSLRRVVSSNGE